MHEKAMSKVVLAELGSILFNLTREEVCDECWGGHFDARFQVEAFIFRTDVVKLYIL